jgi:DNA segregation ATPase FtsK/SpoIIIE-like protein
MDGVIHRTRIAPKRKFPLGEVIIGLGTALLLSAIFRFPQFLSSFLYGVLGFCVFAALLLTVLLGFVIKNKYKIKINTEYLWAGIIICLVFFTTLHLVFTYNMIGERFTEYLKECYKTLTPAGVVFGVPSFMLFILTGRSLIAAIIILAVLIVIAGGIIVGKIVVDRNENRVMERININAVAVNDTENANDFITENERLQRMLEAKYNELVPIESRKRLEKNKSIIGLTEPIAAAEPEIDVAEPISAASLTPEEINSTTIKEAEQFVNNTAQYGGMYPPYQGAFPPQPQPIYVNDPSLYQPTPQPQPVSLPIRNTRGGRGSINAAFPEQTAMPNIPEQTQKIRTPYYYKKPTLDLIRTESADLSQFDQEALNKKIKLDETFVQFKVKANVVDYNVAPAVTRFEIELEEGERVSKVVSLADDINYALRTSNTRIEAPIEGKNAIGIEVPNQKIGTVSVKDLLVSPEFMSAQSPLSICLGKDINNKPVVTDLAEMPHLLIAGTTGAGKSVCINTILTSLIYKTSPDKLRLLLVDMKQGIELGGYNKLPHLLIPQCIMSATHAVNALKWLAVEMRRRYDILTGQRVPNIRLYHDLPDYKSGRLEEMPYIVMIIDEVADLMAQAKQEVEKYVASLASLARASGIHLILATQRPSVNVISGVIKANIGTRIAFRVLSAIDSRTILDCQGAETLLGRGDMLFKDATGLRRVQGCFVANREIEEIVAFVKNSNSIDFDISLEDRILNGIPDGTTMENYDGSAEARAQDPLFVKILWYAVRAGNVKKTLSIAEVQRIFSVGFGRAGRIIDQLFSAGYISGNTGESKAREVLITREQVEQLYGPESAA